MTASNVNKVFVDVSNSAHKIVESDEQRKKQQRNEEEKQICWKRKRATGMESL